MRILCWYISFSRCISNSVTFSAIPGREGRVPWQPQNTASALHPVAMPTAHRRDDRERLRLLRSPCQRGRREAGSRAWAAARVATWSAGRRWWGAVNGPSGRGQWATGAGLGLHGEPPRRSLFLLLSWWPESHPGRTSHLTSGSLRRRDTLFSRIILTHITTVPHACTCTLKIQMRST